VSGLVVGSGPNGMAAAIVLAQAGLRVTVLEAEQTFGGGTRSADLTLPGFVHDVCSAVHPLAIGSPFFRELPLREHGLEWVQPPAPLAHPLDDGTAVVLERSLDATCDSVGEDGPAYRALMQPLIDAWAELLPDVLAPARFPRNPFAMAQFGVRAIRDARALAETVFRGARAQALFAGLAAHSILPLEMAPSAAFALLLGAAGHVVGWPVPRGGSQKIANALASYFGALGGEVRTGVRVRSVDELEPARIVLCDGRPCPATVAA